MMFATQIQALNQKIIELKGIKRPSLKRVKKTADDMLGAYTDTSKLMKADFKANLKTVKKDDEKVNVKWKILTNTKWHENIHNQLHVYVQTRRERKWQTGVRTWRLCLAWRAGRSCSMPDNKKMLVVLSTITLEKCRLPKVNPQFAMFMSIVFNKINPFMSEWQSKPRQVSCQDEIKLAVKYLHRKMS